MLQSIYVKNLALIDEAELELNNGFSILSGETGAGKSIIIDSISFALGEKVDKGMVRDNSIPALVQLKFTDICEEAKAFLEANDLEVCDEVILTRKITETKTTAKINDENVTANKLRELAGFLIDIHGQSEHQSLLKTATHLLYVDAFAPSDIREIKDNVASLYRQYKDILSRLNEMNSDEELRNREKSFLEFEINEINEANLRLGEDVALEEEYKKLSNYGKIYDAISAASNACGEGGAMDAISLAIRELSAVAHYDDRLNNVLASITSVEDLLSDFNRELNRCADEMVFDEAEFLRIGSRLDLINSLKSKHGSTIEDILLMLAKKQERLDFLNNFEDNLISLNNSLKEVEDKLDEYCDRLTKIRLASARALEEDMINSLKELNFLQVNFAIRIEEANLSSNGKNSAHFMISLNPGEELKPLSLTVSGGELSRIMLALKSCLAKNDSIATLIFDEIDTGISGVTAQRVAAKIREISMSHQVICITHLPQIAAASDNNFFIEKGIVDGKTVTTIKELNEDERVYELARMLSGSDISDSVIETARQMRNNIR